MKIALAALTVVLLLAGGSAEARVTASSSPRVWFAPLPPDLPEHAGGGSRDYMQLFRRGAKWQRAARHVKVFKIYSGWATDIARFSDLRRLILDLRRRKIALAAEVPALVPTDTCGNGIEGFAGPRYARRLAEAIKAAGGTLAYVAFDEPFAFGHLYEGPNACGWSAEKIAHDVAAFVDELRESFPRVVAGDIEPLWSGQAPAAFEAWMETYARITGTALPFFDLDVDFSRLDWVAATKELELFARELGVRFGLISIGAGSGDQQWTGVAEDRLATYEATTGLQPDDVIFQSWLDYPHHVLPETKPGTFTWLIDRYFRPRTALRLDAGTASATATLTSARGAPVPGKALEVAATPADGPGHLSTYTLRGSVPPRATTAVVGFRVNTECGCSGVADFTLYRVSYAAGNRVNRVPNGDFAAGLEGWGLWGGGQMHVDSTANGRGLRVLAAPGEVAAANSSEFPVNAGGRFTLAFDAQVAPRSAGSGYFDIVFLSGTEVARSTIDIAAAPVSLVRPVTGANGAVQLDTGPLAPGRYELEAWFRGDKRWFPSYAATTISRLEALRYPQTVARGGSR